MARMYHQWDFNSSFDAKVVCDPITQHVEWGFSRGEWGIVALMLMRSLYSRFLLSANFQVSVLSSVRMRFSTRGMNLRTRSKKGYQGADYLCISAQPPQLIFPEGRLYKFLPKVQCRELVVCTLRGGFFFNTLESFLHYILKLYVYISLNMN